MPRIRLVSTAIVTAFGLALASHATMAQTATDSHPGAPLALLAGLRPPQEHSAHERKAHQGKRTAHATIAAKMSKKSAAEKFAATTDRTSKEPHKIAVKSAAIAPEQADDRPAEPVSDTIAARVWPVDTTPAADLTPAASSETPDDRLPMSAIVVGGQTVQIASSDQVNAIDLAADDKDRAKAPATAARAVFAAPSRNDDSASPVGSASWIAQVLAALGGAVTAGAVAWFLIGSGPHQMYG